MIVKLNKEYDLGGKKVNEINLDFDKLTGKDLIKAEKDFKARYTGATVKELEDGWAVTVAEVASGIKYGDLLKLEAKDYLKIVNKTRNFLLNTDSEEEKKTNDSEVEILD